MSISFNDKRIKNPVLAVLAAFALAFGIAIAVAAAAIALTLMIVCLPLHPLFVLFGRKGIFRGDGQFIFDKTSFERA